MSQVFGRSRVARGLCPTKRSFCCVPCPERMDETYWRLTGAARFSLRAIVNDCNSQNIQKIHHRKQVLDLYTYTTPPRKKHFSHLGKGRKEGAEVAQPTIVSTPSNLFSKNNFTCRARLMDFFDTCAELWQCFESFQRIYGWSSLSFESWSSADGMCRASRTSWYDGMSALILPDYVARPSAFICRKRIQKG